jgi:uncharacterized protein DUF6929
LILEAKRQGGKVVSLPLCHFASDALTLTARLTARRLLHYSDGADLALDRPAFIRGASSLGWIGDRIVLIQDDVNFVAVVDPVSGAARGIPLPPGNAGMRQFDDVRGNKQHRLDLEACVAVERGAGTTLLAFGSGSSRRRESVLVVEGFGEALPAVTLVAATRFYRLLRTATSFSGSELNLEGVLLAGDRLRLFSRGNGAPADGMLPVNAACSVDLDLLLAHLRHPDSIDPPQPTDIMQYDLGVLDGVPLGFTDAMGWHDSVLYVAAAESSPDAVRDGPIAGSAIGVIDPDGSTRWAPITDASGARLRVKAEGLVADPTAESRVFVVLDADDPAAPSELCSVELEGPWGIATR